MRLGCAALVVLAVLGISQGALAYEDQIGLGVAVGYGHAVSDTVPAHGALGELSASLGIGEAWTLRGRGGYALHPGDAPAHVLHAAADLLFVVDVVEIVPYVGPSAGGFATLQDGALAAEPAIGLVLGADYLASREIAFELEARAALLPAALDSDPARFSFVAGLVWLFDR